MSIQAPRSCVRRGPCDKAAYQLNKSPATVHAAVRVPHVCTRTSDPSLSLRAHCAGAQSLHCWQLLCRRRLLECLDLVSTTLGLLINLAEQDKACQPLLAGLALPHGRRMVPLLCRLMQVLCQDW